jgi:hypothetical protein
MPEHVLIGFSSSKKLLSRVIRWFTNSKTSHTFIVIKDSFLGQDMVLQATLGGFQLMTYTAFKKDSKVIFLFEPLFPVDVGLKNACQWLGQHYDYTGLFGSVFVLCGRWLKLKWSNPLDDSDAMFCSEAVVKVLQSNPLSGTGKFIVSSTTPQDLLSFMQTSPAFRVTTA